MIEKKYTYSNYFIEQMDVYMSKLRILAQKNINMKIKILFD